MAVMQSLAHRLKEQTDEAFNLVAELMPPLAKGNTFLALHAINVIPIDGVFDHRTYSEKALAKVIKHNKIRTGRPEANPNAFSPQRSPKYCTCFCRSQREW
jgi:E3 ubiquitin-protein ligase TRIP12